MSVASSDSRTEQVIDLVIEVLYERDSLRGLLWLRAENKETQ